MDPNETLRLLRDALAKMNETEDQETDDWDTWAGLAGAHAEDLDEWLSKGGFLPDAWNQDRTLQPHTTRADELRPGHVCPEGVVRSVEVRPGQRASLYVHFTNGLMSWARSDTTVEVLGRVNTGGA